MVDLIIYPNPRIDQKLLLESIKRYNNRTDKPVNMRILSSEIITDKNNEDKDILQLFLEIRNSRFKCKTYRMKESTLNKNKTVWVKASFETVKVNYSLKKSNGNKYRVERNDTLFLLLNYALQQHDRVTPGNNQGFKNLTSTEITNTLDNLNFGAMVKQWYGQNTLFAMDMDKWEEISVRQNK